MISQRGYRLLASFFFHITFTCVHTVTSESFVGQLGTHIKYMKAPPWFAPSREIFKICSSIYTETALPAWIILFLDFFVKHFLNYLSLHCKKLYFVNDFKNSCIQIKILYGYKLMACESC